MKVRALCFWFVVVSWRCCRLDVSVFDFVYSKCRYVPSNWIALHVKGIVFVLLNWWQWLTSLAIWSKAWSSTLLREVPRRLPAAPGLSILTTHLSRALTQSTPVCVSLWNQCVCVIFYLLFNCLRFDWTVTLCFQFYRGLYLSRSLPL